MRLISGKYKGFRFPANDLKHSRPTTDRVKESLFNILSQQMDLEGLDILDLYAGTGSVGFEFLSRGATSLKMVDINTKNIFYLKKVHAMLKERDDSMAEVKFIKSAVLPYIKKCNTQFDVIFADPPYDSSDYAFITEAVFENELLKPGGTFILEHSTGKIMKHERLSYQRAYGQSTLSFFTFE